MKALIIGADAAVPDIIFRNIGEFPTLGRMIAQGASGAYSAYVQRGYKGSYSSEQNWASIYTGLSPGSHRITTRMAGTAGAGGKTGADTEVGAEAKAEGGPSDEGRRPQMADYDGLQPLWRVLNDCGLSVGLWAADNCANPVEIDGYAVYFKYGMIETPAEIRTAPRELQLCGKDRFLIECLPGPAPPRLYPRTLAQQGYSYSQLLRDPALAEKAVSEYCFQDSLQNFDEELKYFFGGMRGAQRRHPVDVMHFYTVTTDLIAHCCMCCDDSPVLIGAYRLLDRYIGEFVAEFQPEITVFLSDHGMQNFCELVKCSDPAVRREAFAAADEVLWLKNGYIAFEAHNGALLFTAHSLKGVFIACGSGIRHAEAAGMRTLDIYPTLLEALGAPIPRGREGFVADIFGRPLVNGDKLLAVAGASPRPRKKIALVQSHAMSAMDIFINELYIEQRFSDITVAGEAKYEEIFRNNPRVFGFVDIERFDGADFDEVYCGFFNETTKAMRHVRVK
ncbi:MAG: alkaline phosphatase family protein [Clostridiales bacterium]|jgi:hypothetical protein|nr:alkaline phosphatase family protein [Clostridiales bacterium]